MKNIATNAPPGFKITIATAALSVITALVYRSIYASSRYMSWWSFGIMLVGVVLAVALVILNQRRFAPSALLVGNFLSLLFYVYYIYFYISSVVTGIQFSGFPLEFFINAGFYAISLIMSIVCVFMKQTDEN